MQLLITIGILLLGIFVGKLLQSQTLVLKWNAKAVEISIYALLFLLGVGVGSNQQILDNYHKIGLSVILITSMSIAGSVLVAWLVYKFWFTHK